MRYDEYLFSLGLAPSTIRMYRSMMRKAHAWAAENSVDLTDPRPSELAALKAEFVESSSTLRQLRCALVHWWEMMEVHQPPVRALRVPRKPIPRWRGLETERATRLAQASVGWFPEGTAVLVALFTGLRRMEIAKVRWGRFSSDLDWYTVTGKGGYTDTIPIHPALRTELITHRTGHLYLFPGRTRPHVTPATIWEWVRTVAKAADVGHVSTHQLRHTAINKMYQVTKDIRVAQEFARHRRVDTTQIYTRVTADQLWDAMTSSLTWLDDENTAA